MAKRTRSSSSYRMTDFVGSPEALPEADLPTNRSVLRDMLKQRLDDVRDARNIPIAELAKRTGERVIELWLKMNRRMETAIISQQEVARRLVKLHEHAEVNASGGKNKRSRRCRSRGRSVSGTRKKGEKSDYDEFVNSLDRLFDISICRCPIRSCRELGCPPDCHQQVHITCQCLKSVKIPVLELPYIFDQRNKKGIHGNMQMGAVDSVETARQMRADLRTAVRPKQQRAGEDRAWALELC